MAVGSAADTALALVNQTATHLEVELSLTRGAFDLGLQRLHLDAGTQAAIPLRFAPDQDGEFVARLRVVGQQLEAVISGIGAPPPDLQTPAALDLGEVELGQVGLRPLVVRNTGRGPLHLLALKSSRLEYGTADSLPLLVPPGGERIVQIWFAPRAPGRLRGVLRLLSDDPDQGDWALALSGQGKVGNWKPPRLVSQIEGGAETFDFGSLAAGATAERALTLINHGAGVLRVSSISADDPQISAEPESLVVAPGERRQVRVRVGAELGAGAEGILELISDDPTQPLQRWRWHYHQAAAQAQVLSLPLRFGVSEHGRRRAQLAIANRGEAQLVVDLADAQGQLAFAADRLLVTPGQVGRVQVEYRGQSGSGLLQLPSSDPAQPQLEIPWEAPELLGLIRTTPAAGSTDVARRSTLSFFFDQPLRVEGLEGALIPAPLNAWRRQLQVEGGQLRIPLDLAADQSYKLVLLALESQSGARLAEPVELSFTTGSQAQPLGRIQGRATRTGGAPLAGTALLAGQGQELAGAARIDSAGHFELAQLPAGTYYLFVREEGSALSYEYPQALQLRAGQTLNGLTVQMPPGVLAGEAFPIATAIEVDQAPLLQADSTFVLPLRTGPVRELTGFALSLSFDPQALRLIEALPAAPGTRNLLYGAGGFPLFHTTTLAAGQVEFGGDLLAPREESAPDSGGMLAYFVFRALRPVATLQFDRILRRTLRGEDTQIGPTIRPARGADFDGSGGVGLDDLFLMADVFGQRASGAAARFDLDGSGTVDLGDFFLYADAFGLDGSARAKLLALARTLFGLPSRCELQPAYPNPFNSQTLIPYLLPEPSEVRLEIYDLLGQRVRLLVAGPQEAGTHQVSWDGRDDLDRQLASGLYLYRLRAGGFSQSRKLMLLR